MKCNGGCPYRSFGGPTYPSNLMNMQPFQVSQPRDNENVVEYVKRMKREITDFEKEFKSEDKKKEDHKPKMRSFNVFEVASILMLGGPLVAIAYGKLIQTAITSLQVIH
jgi:hypothetical protein